MTSRGIPTTYKNIVFRSRLEAAWAVFFDLLGWEWSYEPFDLSGWIPDFSLRMFNGALLLVEVKPFLAPDVPSGPGAPLPLLQTQRKIDRAIKDVPDQEVLLLGLEPYRHLDVACLGVFRDGQTRSWAHGWWTLVKDPYGHAHYGVATPHTRVDRMTGYTFREGTRVGDPRLHGEEDVPLRRMWARARNQVQWSPELPVLDDDA